MTQGSPPAAGSREEAFRAVLDREAEARQVEVEGATVRYRVWHGPDDATPVLLVHGMLAHSHWWDAVAGWLCRDRRVVALDLSGMGDSGRRDAYSRAQHGREIAAVAQDAELSETMLVAHSYGGDPAIRAARLHPDRFCELVLLDCRLMLPGVASAAAAAGMSMLRRTVYPTVAEASRRFRLLPDSPFTEPVLLDHVMRHSIGRCEDGWSWKYDADMDPEADPADPLPTDGLKMSVTFVRGADSVATPPEQMDVTRRHFPFAEVLEIPACGHHVMLDQPVALTTLLRARLN